ncbi:serine O-acetyltransferase EpsC [Streptomyces sp. NPDC001406]|uniref:serine O-acetyltransferase EpsC n=1 Tax=Streptomyces sp. NPDC001406 TaxID=3364572 RepID=UPI00367E5F70
MPEELSLLRTLGEDLAVVVARDPSLSSRLAAVGHTGLSAVWAHRVAHRLYRRRLRTAASLIARTARRRTGVEIHPGAVLGRRVFIDHGASVVIGQTAVVGDDVTIYQQVTLGAVGWWTDNLRPPGARRHPVVGDGVVLGANATVLGPVTIGDRALIGAMATVTEDLPPGARVYAPRSVVRPGPGLRPVPDTAPAAHEVSGPQPDAVRLLASAGSW